MENKRNIYCGIRQMWSANSKEIQFSPLSKNLVIDCNNDYDIKFEKDSSGTQMELKALKNIEVNSINNILFPKPRNHPNENFSDLDWISDQLCHEQKQAVLSIVNGSAFPAPYILFGPPGTGKTLTLTEAIAQIWLLNSDARILVCAPSNPACDEVALRLLKQAVIHEEDMLRYYSMSQVKKLEVTNHVLDKISNVSKRINHKNEAIQPIQPVENHKIIICTLSMSNRIGKNGLPSNFFNYIFIDEAGSATEPAAIGPIEAFTAKDNNQTEIILAGDSKQLGPVILCKEAENLGLGISLLERLMNMKMYQPNQSTGAYDKNFLTHLVRNFRSYDALLLVPNNLFYDGKLISCASESQTNLAIGWNILPNPSFPISFIAVRGNTESTEHSTSKFNKQELYIVLEYVKDILKNGINGQVIDAKDIGIISPYKKQCELIKKWVKYLRNGRDIEVDTVEKFQGQERDIIIVSTVRSKTNTIGFLDNPKVRLLLLFRVNLIGSEKKENGSKNNFQLKTRRE